MEIPDLKFEISDTNAFGFGVVRGLVLRIGSRPETVDFGAGWSSPVARWAHNPKVAGSNPAPATNLLVWDFKFQI